jgi:hypothetical protein
VRWSVTQRHAIASMNHPEDIVPTTDDSSELAPAELSYGVALLPARALRVEIASASRAIEKQFGNANLVDERTFPAHLSVFLGGTSGAAVPALEVGLGLLKTVPDPHLDVTALEKGDRGFLSLAAAREPDLLRLAEGILGLCAAAHRAHPRYRPHILARWTSLGEDRRQRLIQYGTYRTLQHWKPHISVASVKPDDLDAAHAVAAQLVRTPQRVAVERLQLVDIGHNNERWQVLADWRI